MAFDVTCLILHIAMQGTCDAAAAVSNLIYTLWFEMIQWTAIEHPIWFHGQTA
jgi:hypothetical protein